MVSFRGFLEPLRAVRMLPDVLVVRAPSAFLRDWARDHYAAELSHEATAIAGAPVNVQVIFDEDGQAPAPIQEQEQRAEPGVDAAPSRPMREDTDPRAVSSHAPAAHRSTSVLPLRNEALRERQQRRERLNPKYTFENFVTGPSNRIAYAAGTDVAEHPGAHYTPLFLFGPTGVGKTHLLHAIGNEALAQHSNLRVVALTAEQWVNEYIRDVHDKKFEDFRRRYRDGCDVLLLDDIQFLSGKSASQDEFFHTFNALYEAHKPIVVTSDRYPHEIAGLEERLRSRLQWGLIVDVQPPEIETRLSILAQKAEHHGVALPMDVAEYLATTMTSSIRELEGALLRLQAYASITREPLSLHAAREHLRPMLALKSAEVSIPRILDVVAAYYGLRANDLRGPSRQRQVARARQVAMYLVRTHLHASLPEIGRAVGDRDHTTVLASVRKIAELLQSDAGVQAVIHKLATSLFA